MFRTYALAVVCSSTLALAGCANSSDEEEEVVTVEPDPEMTTEPEEEKPVEEEEEEEEVVEEVIEPTPIVGAQVLEDLNDDPNIVEVELRAEPTTITLGEGLDVEMYAYNGSVPGPLLEATVGDKVIVHFTNDLPEPTTVHWHGLRISDRMDGNPRIQDPVQPGESFTYEFVVPDEGTYWYHPHVRSNEQIEKGLYAPLVVREPQEVRPRPDRERWLVLDDILLDGDQHLPFLANHMEFMHGRFGNVLLTNGKADLVGGNATVGEDERWGIVNTANARTMEIGISGASFRVVGTDGGRVEPYTTERLVLPVGQRYDVEVVYDVAAPVALQQYVLARNDQGEIIEKALDVMLITVAEGNGESTQVSWSDPEPMPEREIDREETVVFDAIDGPSGIEWRLNGESHAMEPMFVWDEGETVRLILRNELGPEHPFHLHGQFFQIPGVPGLKDIVLVPGQSTVEIIAYLDNPGRWMMHCHINEHSEIGMMGEFVVRELDD